MKRRVVLVVDHELVRAGVRSALGVLGAFAREPVTPRDPELEQLTSREQEVLRPLARGYAYKEISSRLSISIKTVESHASAVLRKLQLSSRKELSRWAAERKLV